jgi:F0F1-type ATP synthase membrane subunit b/b'
LHSTFWFDNCLSYFTDGTAEMERQVQNQVLSMAAKTSNAIAEETGVQASMNENELKDYVQDVMKELQENRPQL